MDITFYQEDIEIASIELPDNAPLFNVGDELNLMSPTETAFVVTKRTYIAYFPKPKGKELGSPNSQGWRMDVTPKT